MPLVKAYGIQKRARFVKAGNASEGLAEKATYLGKAAWCCSESGRMSFHGVSAAVGRFIFNG